jgi:hypothetical protein
VKVLTPDRLHTNFQVRSLFQYELSCFQINPYAFPKALLNENEKVFSLNSMLFSRKTAIINPSAILKQNGG